MEAKQQTTNRVKPFQATLTAIAAHFTNNVSVLDIASYLCLALSTTYFWFKRFKTEGLDGMKYKQRGRPIGSGRLLKPDQEDNIQGLITSSQPSDYGLNFSTWTRKAAVELVYKLYETKIAVRTMGDYLKRWSMTPRKPVKHAIQRNEEKILEWRNVIFRSIWERAKSIGALMCFGDEQGFNTHNNNEKSYSPVGQTPTVNVTGTRFSINVISAITLEGLMRYMTYDVPMNAKLFISFMARLIEAAHGVKVFFIVDNLKLHHSKLVSEWLGKHTNEIEIFYLPAYAPELNPVEYLNNMSKQMFRSAKQPTSKEEFLDLTGKVLKTLQLDRKKVRSCFDKDEVKYIKNNGL
jgi:transposase